MHPSREYSSQSQHKPRGPPYMPTSSPPPPLLPFPPRSSHEFSHSTRKPPRPNHPALHPRYPRPPPYSHAHSHIPPPLHPYHFSSSSTTIPQEPWVEAFVREHLNPNQEISSFSSMNGNVRLIRMNLNKLLKYANELETQCQEGLSMDLKFHSLSQTIETPEKTRNLARLRTQFERKWTECLQLEQTMEKFEKETIEWDQINYVLKKALRKKKFRIQKKQLNKLQKKRKNEKTIRGVEKNVASCSNTLSQRISSSTTHGKLQMELRKLEKLYQLYQIRYQKNPPRSPKVSNVSETPHAKLIQSHIQSLKQQIQEFQIHKKEKSKSSQLNPPTLFKESIKTRIETKTLSLPSMESIQPSIDLWSQRPFIQTIDELIVIRKQWDLYLIGSNMGGQTIPMHWVQPPPNPSKDWERYGNISSTF